MKQNVTVIEDMVAVGNIEAVKEAFILFSKAIKEGKQVILYRQAQNSQNEEVAYVFRTIEELNAFQSRLIGE